MSLSSSWLLEMVSTKPIAALTPDVAAGADEWPVHRARVEGKLGTEFGNQPSFRVCGVPWWR